MQYKTDISLAVNRRDGNVKDFHFVNMKNSMESKVKRDPP